MAKSGQAIKTDEIKKKAENDLFFFARLINPNRIYGEVHKEVFNWLTRDKAKANQLILLPRGHQKSHCIAVWCAWLITRNPAITILYVSATEKLAIKQLYSIQQMLECEEYQALWPEMIHPDKGKREKWSATEIIIDHPFRKQMGVRDSTVMVGSIGSNTTGLHCDALVFDDIVVPDNAYTAIGREAVEDAYSQFSSVANPGSVTKAVGTRYHPIDIYFQMSQETIPVFDKEGCIVKEEPLWEVYEKTVENKGDGTGEFLWPRTQHPITKRWEGFNVEVLATIRAKYKDKAHYYSQYYNDPNDPESARLDYNKFQYYDPKYLRSEGGTWYFKNSKLKLFAAGDFAYTDSSKSDFSAIAVVGVDEDGFIYVLDLDRYKTTKYDVHYETILRMATKWNLKRIRLESNAGANLIIEAVKDRVRQEGGSLVVDAKYVSANGGTKKERIEAVLEPRYETQTIWHFRGGLTPALEEEVIQARPAHDDLKDALAAAIEISKPPMKGTNLKVVPIKIHSRFGGQVR